MTTAAALVDWIPVNGGICVVCLSVLQPVCLPCKFFDVAWKPQCLLIGRHYVSIQRNFTRMQSNSLRTARLLYVGPMN
ncbi:hypothetical protein EG68_11970 [Paragonimus skrjabini miyazakii]|uniref:Uncharacterized protein n=1 Tax=Paragonimus skrjabini miyazakii TaxID=59628 RepID=A0A8S9YPC8_9TREM|nr:hypothetical protein EG68_11970 [Paragonimus skrjabini miyazakii]